MLSESSPTIDIRVLIPISKWLWTLLMLTSYIVHSHGLKLTYRRIFRPSNSCAGRLGLSNQASKIRTEMERDRNAD